MASNYYMDQNQRLRRKRVKAFYTSLEALPLFVGIVAIVRYFPQIITSFFDSKTHR